MPGRSPSGWSTKSEGPTGRPRQYYSFDDYEMHSWEEAESLEEERDTMMKEAGIRYRGGVYHG
jgi:hypothetical protein